MSATEFQQLMKSAEAQALADAMLSGDVAPKAEDLQREYAVSPETAIRSLYATLDRRSARVAVLVGSAIGGYKNWPADRLRRLVEEFEAKEQAVAKVLTMLRAELAERQKTGDMEAEKA